MRKKEIKLPMTPITEDTFIRQGWKKVEAGDGMNDDGDDEGGHFIGFYQYQNLEKMNLHHY